jgi:hypothetical protein
MYSTYRWVTTYTAYHSVVASGEEAAVELLLEDCWLHAEVGDRRARLSEAAKASLRCDGPNLADVGLRTQARQRIHRRIEQRFVKCGTVATAQNAFLE